jgi:hypothetical protein
VIVAFYLEFIFQFFRPHVAILISNFVSYVIYDALIIANTTTTLPLEAASAIQQARTTLDLGYAGFFCFMVSWMVLIGVKYHVILLSILCVQLRPQFVMHEPFYGLIGLSSVPNIRW